MQRRDLRSRLLVAIAHTLDGWAGSLRQIANDAGSPGRRRHGRSPSGPTPNFGAGGESLRESEPGDLPASDGPPEYWLERIGQDGPPAHWLERVRGTPLAQSYEYPSQPATVENPDITRPPEVDISHKTTTEREVAEAQTRTPEPEPPAPTRLPLRTPGKNKHSRPPASQITNAGQTPRIGAYFPVGELPQSSAVRMDAPIQEKRQSDPASQTRQGLDSESQIATPNSNIEDSRRQHASIGHTRGDGFGEPTAGELARQHDREVVPPEIAQRPGFSRPNRSQPSQSLARNDNQAAHVEQHATYGEHRFPALLDGMGASDQSVPGSSHWPDLPELDWGQDEPDGEAPTVWDRERVQRLDLEQQRMQGKGA